jgi:hypothetical protein
MMEKGVFRLMHALAEISLYVRSAPRVYDTQTCKEAMDTMFANPEAASVVVTNRTDRPVGLLMCSRFFHRLTGLAGMEMMLREPVTKLMSQHPLVADLDVSPQDLLDKASRRAPPMRNDSIIIVEEGKVKGIVQPSDLM